MAEIRGCDLVVEYLIKEKVPYLFGYAGHGAVGLLDGVYNRSDEIKIIFPRIESAAGYMADAYFRASGQVIPVYTSTGPGPMLLTVAMGNAFYDSSAFIAITGQVATNQYDSGALQEEYRHYQADFPSIARVISKRSVRRRSPSRTSAKFLPKAFKLARTGRPGPVHLDVPYDLWIRTGRRRGARAGGALPDAELADAGLAGGGRQGARDADEGAAAADPRRRRRDLLRRDAGAAGVRRARERARLLDLHGQGRPVAEGPALPRHRRLLGRVPGAGGGAQRRRDPRDRLPLLRHPLLLVGARLHVQHPADEADPRRHRPDRDRPQLPDRARHRRRRPRGAEAAGRAGAEAAEARADALARPGRGLEARVAELHRAGEGLRRDADRPAARDRRAAQGGARRHADDHRHGQPPDLGRAVLGRLRAALGVHAGRLRRDGLRHLRRARRQAREARAAGRLRHERRQLHDVPGRGRDRGRARHPGRLGDPQQLHDRRDPRPPALLHGQPRDRDELHQAVDRRVLEPGLRQDGRGDGRRRRSRSTSPAISRTRSTPPSRRGSRTCST